MTNDQAAPLGEDSNVDQITLSDYSSATVPNSEKSLFPVPHDHDDVDDYLPHGRTNDIDWIIQECNHVLYRSFNDFDLQPSAVKAALSVYQGELENHLAPTSGPSPNALDQFIHQMENAHYNRRIRTVIQLINSLVADAIETRDMSSHEIREGINDITTTIDFYSDSA